MNLSLLAETIPSGLLLSLMAMKVYFLLAKKYEIVDKPNERSSHSIKTFRGGGIIFPIVAIAAIAYLGLSVKLALALFLVSIISVYDDIRSIKVSIRLLFHFVSFALVIWDLLPWVDYYILLPVLFIICIGAINAYNFMDGINGITGLYSITLIMSFILLNNRHVIVDEKLFYFLITPIVVFLFYNFRRRARCFGGDVGSVSIALIVVYFLLMIILKTGRIEYIFLMGLYGIDSIFTIIERIIRKENIFQAHRRHIYQILANEHAIDHRVIALAYGVLQLILNYILITVDHKLTFILSVYGLLAIGYIGLKSYLIRSKNIA